MRRVDDRPPGQLGDHKQSVQQDGPLIKGHQDFIGKVAKLAPGLKWDEIPLALNGSGSDLSAESAKAISAQFGPDFIGQVCEHVPADRIGAFINLLDDYEKGLVNHNPPNHAKAVHGMLCATMNDLKVAWKLQKMHDRAADSREILCIVEKRAKEVYGPSGVTGSPLIDDNGSDASLIGQTDKKPEMERSVVAAQVFAPKQEANNTNFLDWCGKNSIGSSYNSGDKDNCLIIALLQHAKNEYQSVKPQAGIDPHPKLTELAAKIRADLKIMPGMLFADNGTAMKILREINEKYLQPGSPPLTLVEIQAGSEGPMVMHNSNGSASGSRPVMVFLSNNHFEALYKLPSPVPDDQSPVTLKIKSFEAEKDELVGGINDMEAKRKALGLSKRTNQSGALNENTGDEDGPYLEFMIKAKQARIDEIDAELGHYVKP
jgi:hypothetical protein